MNVKYLKIGVIALLIYVSILSLFIFIGYLTTQKSDRCLLNNQIMNVGGHIFPTDYRVLQP